MTRALILIALASCAEWDNPKTFLGGTGLDLPFFDLVYECDATTTAVPQELAELELCSDLDAEALARSLNENGFEGATCWPTDRHLGPCLFHCDGGSGCNALNGCWCPP